MTAQEERRYHRRIHLFHQARGMELGPARELAERLFDRDRDHDTRHSCVECAHLKQRSLPNEWGNTRNDLGCWAGAESVDFECLHHCARFEWQMPTKHPELFPLGAA